MSQRGVKNLNYSKSWSNFPGKKWSNISTRRQHNFTKKNNHSFRFTARRILNSFSCHFSFSSEKPFIIIRLPAEEEGSTWCSNQWERDLLEQNSVPFLAVGHVAFTIDFVLKAQTNIFGNADSWKHDRTKMCQSTVLLLPLLYAPCNFFHGK